MTKSESVTAVLSLLTPILKGLKKMSASAVYQSLGETVQLIGRVKSILEQKVTL